jgi:hypothetical protein
MDFADSPEHAAFRAEIRRWLDENLPADIKVDDAADQRVAADRETLEKRILWQKRMHAAGWVGISWPSEYGGRGADLMQQAIFDEEYFRARAPVLPTASALNLLGPTLMHWGSDAQKRHHLPRILAADELWCQGYSEPGAGADLASLRTRAADRGDHFLVNGQKVWTSGRSSPIGAFCWRAPTQRRRSASRHQLPAGRHEDAGDQRAPAGAPERPPALQRGVLRRRRGAEGESGRAVESGLEGMRRPCKSCLQPKNRLPGCCSSRSTGRRLELDASYVSARHLTGVGYYVELQIDHKPARTKCGRSRDCLTGRLFGPRLSNQRIEVVSRIAEDMAPPVGIIHAP